MTPCEKLGYKVGDKFVVISSMQPKYYRVGDIVTLLEDDTSHSPLFEVIRGTQYGGNKWYIRLEDIKRLEEPTDNPVDEVEHPSHYTDGAIECIDAIRAALSPSEFQGFLKGNALKYLWRMNLKGKTVVDAQKCDWYINRLVKELTE